MRRLREQCPLMQRIAEANPAKIDVAFSIAIKIAISSNNTESTAGIACRWRSSWRKILRFAASLAIGQSTAIAPG